MGSCRSLLVRRLFRFQICVHIIRSVQKLKMNTFTVILFGTCLLVALTAVSAARLACPPYRNFFQLKHVELNACKKNTDCFTGDICCWWGKDQRCKKAIDPTPRPGQCPQISDVPVPCMADYVGCYYDNECGANEKCCPTSCGYNDCA